MNDTNSNMGRPIKLYNGRRKDKKKPSPKGTGGCHSSAVMDPRNRTGVDSWTVRLLLLVLLGVHPVWGQGTGDASYEKTSCQVTKALVPAMFVFGDSVLDAGTNSLFLSLAQANFKPYGAEYFGKPTGRFSNGRLYPDFFAGKIGLPFPEPYLKRKGGNSIVHGVNYASAGSGILRTTNAETKVIPFPDQFLQFEQTRLTITQTLRSASAAETLFSKSLFLINIGGNDLVSYILSPTPPLADYLAKLMDVVEESVATVYKAGGRKFALLGVGPVGCVPAVLLASGIQDGSCLESANDITKAFNAALEEFVLNRLPEVFKDIKAIVGKPFKTLGAFVNNGTSGFTEGVKACCGSGLYNAESQCGQTSDLIKNPPYNLCDNVDAYVFWDYFHPTERVYGLVADKLWDGGLDFIAPMNLKTLVNL